MYLPSTAPIPRNSMSPLDPACLQARVSRGRQIEAAAIQADLAVNCFASPESFSPWGTNLVADVVQSQNTGISGSANGATSNPDPGGGNSDAPIVVPMNPSGGQIPGGCAIPVAPRATVVMPRMIPSQRIRLRRDPVQPSQDLILVEDPIRSYGRTDFSAPTWATAYASLNPGAPVMMGPAAPVSYDQIVNSGLGQIAPPWGDELVNGSRGSNGSGSSGSFVQDHPWLTMLLALGIVLGVDQLSK